MKVTKEMVHGDLRSRYRMLSALRPVFGNRVLVSAFNTVLKRSHRGRDIDGLECSEVLVPGHDGVTKIRTRIYRPSNHHGDLPAMLYIHGGGYISGIPEQAGNEIRRFIETRACVVIAPDYRLALEAPHPRQYARAAQRVALRPGWRGVLADTHPQG